MGPPPHGPQGDPLTRAAAGSPVGLPTDRPGGPPARGAARPDVAALVVAAQAGDRGAFEELVRVTYVDSYTLAYRLTGDEDDARDVVQEAYLRAYRALGSFRGDAQFTTWLYRITANCATTFLGKRSRHRHDELTEELAGEEASPGHGPEALVDAAATRDRLQQALRRLPPRLRAVVVLRDIYDLPHESIAAELGISESAAKVRLHRARRKLRADLATLHDHDEAEGGTADARAV